MMLVIRKLTGRLAVAGALAALLLPMALVTAPTDAAVAAQPEPSKLIMVTGNGQSVPGLTPFNALRIEALDQISNPIPQVPITFSIVAKNTAFPGTAAFPGGAQTVDTTTDSSGIATAPTLTAGMGVGPLLVQATFSDRISKVFELQVEWPRTDALVAVSGGGQSTVVGTKFAQPLVVKAQLSNGEPPEDGEVEFSASNGTFAGEHSATVGVNQRTGLATSPPLTAATGSAGGSVTVTARAVDNPDVTQTFTLTATRSVAAALTLITGDYQLVAEETTLRPVTIELRDQVGRPLPDTLVTFTVTGPVTIGGGHSSAQLTDSDGTVTVMPLAGKSYGPVSIAVTSGSVSLAKPISARVLETPPATFSVLDGDKQSAIEGETFSSPLRVLLFDHGGIIPNWPLQFQITGPATFAGGATMLSTMTTTGGGYTSPSLIAGNSSGKVTVTATAAGSDTVLTFTLIVTAPRISGVDHPRTPVAAGELARIEPARTSPQPRALARTGFDGWGGVVAGLAVTAGVALTIVLRRRAVDRRALVTGRKTG